MAALSIYQYPVRDTVAADPETRRDALARDSHILALLMEKQPL
jgi:hypothetical protein